MGQAAGGPLGGAFGQLGGRLVGTLMEGGDVDTKQVLKSAGALAGGALFGKAGGMIGGALGGAFGGDVGEGGGEAGATTVGGGNTEGGMGEAIRLLTEISRNIKSMVTDGIVTRGDHSRKGSVL